MKITYEEWRRIREKSRMQGQILIASAFVFLGIVIVIACGIYEVLK